MKDFGVEFEAILAKGMSELVLRLDGVKNQVWYALLEENIVGVVWIDGECLNPDSGIGEVASVELELYTTPTAGEGGKKAYLRYFIVDGSMQGKGIGKRLIDKAVEFCDERGFEACELSTFTGTMFDAARKVYGSRGFVQVREVVGRPWGAPLLQQFLVRKRGGVV